MLTSSFYCAIFMATSTYTRANLLKSRGAKLKGLRAAIALYGSQLPKYLSGATEVFRFKGNRQTVVFLILFQGVDLARLHHSHCFGCCIRPCLKPHCKASSQKTHARSKSIKLFQKTNFSSHLAPNNSPDFQCTRPLCRPLFKLKNLRIHPLPSPPYQHFCNRRPNP